MNDYICIYCGIQCKNGKSFGAHLTNCKRNPKYEEIHKKRICSKTVQRHNYNFKCLKCDQQFTLELTINQYTSGKYRKYCSRKCANSRAWTDQDNLKKSISSKASIKVRDSNRLPRLRRNGNISSVLQYITLQCPVCKSQFLTKNKNRKFCSRECSNKGEKLGFYSILKPKGGFREINGQCRSKRGWYNGIWCDSSWELAYVIYCKEHNIDIQRNKVGFEYLYNGEKHLYYPDFKLDQNFVQIKGYKDEIWKQKLIQFPKKLTVLSEQEIKPYIQYVVNKYGRDFIKLYQNRE